MKKAMPAGKQGFTLTELLIVLAILVIVLVFSVAVFSNLTKGTDLDTSRNNIISTLNKTRNAALASEGAAQYGVYFDSSTEPDRYVFFKGSSYALRDISFDKIYNLPPSVGIPSLSFNGGNNEIVFKRLDGSTNNFGSLTIQSLSTSETRNIYIYSSGEIGMQPESTSDLGRISDSRHVHFNLGWSITGATTLKFNFINAGQIELVPMADYFTSTSFDWGGEFIVNSIIQKFRVHTHQLDPSTLLCIHRDRNEEKNTEEVYIYIVQGGVEKEIAHYLADADDTVIEGLYGGTKEKQ